MPGPTRQTALITGASSGIGDALARRFAKAGHNLVLVARRRDALEKLAAELSKSAAIEVHVIPCDLTDAQAPGRILSDLEQSGISIDILVNNAGFGAQGRFDEIEESTQIDILQLNIVALTRLTRLVLPQMVQRGRGMVLNVASTAAFQPGPYMAVYYASKAYVLSFSEALSEELRKKGVTVTALCPGATRTEFDQRAGMTESRLFTGATMDAATVAELGYAGLMRGRRVVICGLRNRIMALGSRFAPKSLVLRIAKRLNRAK
jgi:hypothetical protein